MNMRHFGVGAWLGGMIHTKKKKKKKKKKQQQKKHEVLHSPLCKLLDSYWAFRAKTELICSFELFALSGSSENVLIQKLSRYFLPGFESVKKRSAK